MSHNKRRKAFHPTLSHYIRWILFGIICVFTINYLSTNQKNLLDPTLILGETTTDTISLSIIEKSINKFLPTVKIGPLPQIQPIIDSTIKFVNNVPQFVNKTIINFKKDIITQIYNDLIKNIEKK